MKVSELEVPLSSLSLSLPLSLSLSLPPFSHRCTLSALHFLLSPHLTCALLGFSSLSPRSPSAFSSHSPAFHVSFFYYLISFSGVRLTAAYRSIYAIRGRSQPTANSPQTQLVCSCFLAVGVLVCASSNLQQQYFFC